MYGAESWLTQFKPRSLALTRCLSLSFAKYRNQNMSAVPSRTWRTRQQSTHGRGEHVNSPRTDVENTSTVPSRTWRTRQQSTHGRGEHVNSPHTDVQNTSTVPSRTWRTRQQSTHGRAERKTQHESWRSDGLTHGRGFERGQCG